MGARERWILIVLSLALAGGLFALVLSKGRQKEADEQGQGPQLGAVGPEGWDLRRVPSAGRPLSQTELAGGVVVQTLEDGQGDALPQGRPFDLHYRVYTLDGMQRARGVVPALTLGANNPLPVGLTEGLAGIKLFEKRRLLVPKEKARSGPSIRVPPGMEAVFDVQPVELVIEDLVVGTGRQAKLNQRITVHYRGTLENGAEFDSSHRRGEPAVFPLREGGLIRGWTDGIPGMRVGGKRRLWIPFHLAYGGRSKAGIPPYSNLVFEIELIDAQ